jgi:hypothetical protein
MSKEREPFGGASSHSIFWYIGMVSNRKTDYLYVPFNDLHRCLGKALYLQDIDVVGVEDGYIAGVYTGVSRNMKDDYLLELTYGWSEKYGGPTKKPCISNQDWHSGHLKRWAKLMQAPAFHVIYFLRRGDAPATYWLPVEEQAKKFLDWLPRPYDGFGKWMTIKQCSYFLHHIKGLEWHSNEVIQLNTIPFILDELVAGSKLKDLPNEPATYPLPKIDWV